PGRSSGSTVASSCERAVQSPRRLKVAVEFDVKGRVATITLNRPEKMNAMDMEMYASISEHLREIDQREDIWVGVVTGAGEKAFTAGADLVGLHGAAAGASASWESVRPTRFDLGLEVQKPLIAAVNGYCLAGGLELALVCDIRVASESAQFGCPEVKWNLLHGYGAQLLPRIVGASNAMYMLLTGQFIDAAEALRIGLVNEVVPRDGLMPCVYELASVICGFVPMAILMSNALA